MTHPPSRVWAREEAATGTATLHVSGGDPSIAPYDTGLDGVNQPINLLFKDMLWWSLGIAGLAILLIRVAELHWSRTRQISAMNLPAHRQNFWRTAQWSWMPWLKRQLIYAPLGTKRRLREFRLSSAMNMGTLPTRFQAILVGLYLLSNVIYMFVLNWHNENRWAFCAELRGRSGTLAAVNMVPLVILAGRNNPLIPLLKISFDTYNLIHRWMGRVVVIEALIHTIAWAIVQVADGGWESVRNKVLHNRFIASGTVGTLCLIILFFLSLSPVRHAFYETFLNTHIILALLVFVFTYIHCVAAELPGGLPQTPWLVAILVLWGMERTARMFRLAYYNWSRDRGFTEAIVEPMPGETTRVTMHLPRYVDVEPGSHAYLRFRGLSLWESHPFSIAWVEHVTEKENLPLTEKESVEVTRNVATTVHFIIGAQTGFTRKLYNAASRGGERAVRIPAFIEGPYGGHSSLDSYGHVMLIAGATGITHQLPYVKHLVAGYAKGTVATRRLLLVWIVRDYDSLEWIRPWVDSILRMEKRKEVLQIRLFITRPKNPREIKSPSQTVQMFPGRPNIPLLIRKEVHETFAGAVCVSSCGGGPLQDEIAAAVRETQGQDPSRAIRLTEAVFSW